MKNQDFLSFFCFIDLKKQKPLRYGGKQALINERKLKLFCLSFVSLRPKLNYFKT